jgi:AcrR family transcriptional regulator
MTPAANPAGEAELSGPNDENVRGDAAAEAAETPPSRTRVLDAAAQVFAEQGLDAPMPAVAAAAGVGVGTIYRAFGSKDELIAALAADRVERFGRDTRAALDRSDPWEALVEVFYLTAEHQAEDYIVTEALASLPDHPSVVKAQDDAGAAISALVQRAKDAGGLRPDFQPEDLQMFFAALGAAQHTAPRGSKAWRRLLGLLIDGLRAEGAQPLTEPPLTGEEIAQAGLERRERRGR